MFKNDAVMALIDFKWPLIKEYTIKLQFIPFVFYSATFIVFSNVFNGQVIYDDESSKQEMFKHAKIALIAILYALSVYQLMHEFA